MPDHKKIWEDWRDRYYLELIDTCLNDVPSPPKPFKQMDEKEFNTWHSKLDFSNPDPGCNNERTFVINIPEKKGFCASPQNKITDVVHLPLSLENNSTLHGTAVIFEEFAKEFSIPCPQGNTVPFRLDNKRFDIVSARAQYAFMMSVKAHRAEMLEIERHMTSEDNVIADWIGDDKTGSDSESKSSGDSSFSESENPSKEDVDKNFKILYDSVSKRILECAELGTEESVNNVVRELTQREKEINTIKDSYGRTIFHVAVEEKNYLMVKILLGVGVNVNSKEGCGTTPLSVAVINSDVRMCKILLENFAEYNGPMFGSIPSPQEMAFAMELNDISDLFRIEAVANDSQLVDVLQRSPELAYHIESPPESTNDNILSNMHEKASSFVYNRFMEQGFPTGIVGDVGTCKINRSVRNRNNMAYGWSTEIPGDMHTKGHLCEAAFKAHGKGGFHILVQTVMNRKKLTKEAFKKRKFQEQNLQHIQEAVKDGSFAFGLAAVQEFKLSDEFPSEDVLKEALRKHGSHNKVILCAFKKWLQRCGECDESHSYHQQLFSLFGPLLDLFTTATREGDGILRETSWVLLLPIFAQLGFRNYWTEAFVHVINFTSLWPLAFRKMLAQNSTVNLTGNSGHNLDLDEYVETYVIRPLKEYATGKYISN